MWKLSHFSLALSLSYPNCRSGICEGWSRHGWSNVTWVQGEGEHLLCLQPQHPGFEVWWKIRYGLVLYYLSCEFPSPMWGVCLLKVWIGYPVLGPCNCGPTVIMDKQCFPGGLCALHWPSAESMGRFHDPPLQLTPAIAISILDQIFRKKLHKECSCHLPSIPWVSL